jgi:hypothetical protein
MSKPIPVVMDNYRKFLINHHNYKPEKAAEVCGFVKQVTPRGVEWKYVGTKL